MRLPKWTTILGGLLAVASTIIQYVPQLQTLIPDLGHSKILTVIVTVAGAILAMYGTPPHANTPTGGVLKSNEPPVINPTAGV